MSVSSKRRPQMSSKSVTWELVRNENFGAPPAELGTLGMGPQGDFDAQ